MLGTTIRVAATLLSLATGLQAQTASKAVSVVQKQYGKIYGSRLVAVTGENGGPQPRDWHLFAYDFKVAGRISHFVVRGEKIATAAMLDDARGKQWAAPVLAWERVKVDSDRAFQMTEALARQAKIAFNTVDYRLMNDRRSGSPTYQLNVKDAAGKSVGQVRIDASSGQILSQNWGALRMPWSGQDRIDWQIVKQEMKSAGREIGDAFRQFRDDVSRKFSR